MTRLTQMERRAVTALVVVTSGYVAAQILADVTSLRIVMIGNFSVDAGTLIYPVTFTLRDLVHRVAGIHAARVAIFMAAGINIFMGGLFWAASRLPADLTVGPQVEFGRVLGPVWRIVLASIIAEVVSELVDGYGYTKWEQWFGERLLWGRVLLSNGIAIPTDSVLFVVIAFAAKVPAATLLSIFWANVLIKGVVTVGSIPLIYTTGPVIGRRRIDVT